MVQLREPIHSEEHLAEKLRAVTNKFRITGSVFTVTRDNATNNTAMLRRLETLAADDNIFRAAATWTFQQASSNVRCMAHVVNFTVQTSSKPSKLILQRILTPVVLRSRMPSYRNIYQTPSRQLSYPQPCRPLLSENDSEVI